MKDEEQEETGAKKEIKEETGEPTSSAGPAKPKQPEPDNEDGKKRSG